VDEDEQPFRAYLAIRLCSSSAEQSCTSSDGPTRLRCSTVRRSEIKTALASRRIARWTGSVSSVAIKKLEVESRKISFGRGSEGCEREHTDHRLSADPPLPACPAQRSPEASSCLPRASPASDRGALGSHLGTRQVGRQSLLGADEQPSSASLHIEPSSQQRDRPPALGLGREVEGIASEESSTKRELPASRTA
jgi:hypothetical protein